MSKVVNLNMNWEVPGLKFVNHGLMKETRFGILERYCSVGHLNIIEYVVADQEPGDSRAKHAQEARKMGYTILLMMLKL